MHDKHTRNNFEMSHIMRKACFSHMRTTMVQISLRSLTSISVVHCLDSITPLLVIAETSRPKLVSVVEQDGCVLPARKPRRHIFSWQGSNNVQVSNSGPGPNHKLISWALSWGDPENSLSYWCPTTLGKKNMVIWAILRVYDTSCPP